MPANRCIRLIRVFALAHTTRFFRRSPLPQPSVFVPGTQLFSAHETTWQHATATSTPDGILNYQKRATIRCSPGTDAKLPGRRANPGNKTRRSSKPLGACVALGGGRMSAIIDGTSHTGRAWARIRGPVVTSDGQFPLPCSRRACTLNHGVMVGICCLVVWVRHAHPGQFITNERHHLLSRFAITGFKLLGTKTHRP